MAGGTPGGNYYERINRLSERLSGLQQGLEHERNSRFDQLSQRMYDVDLKLQQSQETLHSDLALLKDQLVKFQRDFDEERLGREAMTEARSKELGAADLRLQNALEAEQQARRDAEAKVLKTFDERTALLREEIAREGRSRAEAEAALRRYVDVDIPKLYESLREEAQSRETMEDRIVRRASEEISRLQEAILTEKKAREDTEEALLRMMEDTVAKMRAEIAQERADRETTEETLLKLLEETCNKLNAASQVI
mmetsp:Transcript_4132/g.7586  ORF Transcript_4132/g.7586 Transcript_4132/m.7586 type:complete len:253 (-) Transcript_4132:39-797(-)